MKLIDHNGKLFGKINLLDLIIFLLIALLLVGGIYKLFFVDNSIYVPDYHEGEITVLLTGISEYELACIKEGDLIRVPNIQNLGTITKIQVDQRTDTVNSSDGKVYNVKNPLNFELLVVLNTDELTQREESFYVGKNFKLVPGQSLDVTNGVVECKSSILSIESVK